MRSIHITTARDLLADVARIKPAAILSIEHPGAEGDGRAPRLGVDSVQRIQTYWNTEEDGIRKGPTRRGVSSGIRFLERYAKKGPLIVHCRSGKARSPAIALAYLVAANPACDIGECIAHLKTIRPQAAPNILVVALADIYLKRNGALLRAVEADPDFTRNRALANAARAAWAEKNPVMIRARPALKDPATRPAAP